jgi:hypothetical protein
MRVNGDVRGVKCPDCHTRIYYGTEHMSACRYVTLRPRELVRAVVRRRGGEGGGRY